MRSLSIILLDEDSEPLLGAGLTAHPRRMKAVDPHSERMKPLFDVVSERIVKPTAQIEAREDTQIAVAIDQKHRFREIVFPTMGTKNAVAPSVPRCSMISASRTNFVSMSIAA